MKKAVIWIALGILLILIGGCLFVGVLAANDWDFSVFSTTKYEKNTHTVTDAWESVSVETDTADVRFVLSDDASVRVECYESAKEKHAVAVTDGTLSIRRVDTRKWYEHIGIFGASPKLTVYLPAGEYTALTVRVSTGDVEIPTGLSFANADIKLSTGDVRVEASVVGETKIETDTGDVAVSGATLGTLSVTTSTGDIRLSDVTCTGKLSLEVTTGDSVLTNVSCRALASNGTTGDIALHNVTAVEKLTVERDTGDVTFDRCDAEMIDVLTSTGDVGGTLRTSKIFYVDTSTGHVVVPKSTTGGACRVHTSTGDIRMSILP